MGTLGSAVVVGSGGCSSGAASAGADRPWLSATQPHLRPARGHPEYPRIVTRRRPTVVGIEPAGHALDALAVGLGDEKIDDLGVFVVEDAQHESRLGHALAPLGVV